MARINVMVNGIPGNMGGTVARHVLQDERFELVPHSLTGPEITAREHKVGASLVALHTPERREVAMADIKQQFGPFISVDYSHPAAVNANASFYSQQALPFVMGTTGGNRELLTQTVLASKIAAVIAPNMAKQIVGFQAMMQWAAETFPDLFAGFELQIRESHQQGKADTSGTAKAMVQYFNALGVAFEPEQIQKERDPGVQQSQWHIPEQYLGGHGWHTYALDSADGTVHFAFTHNVNGRETYARGTLDAVTFLSAQVQRGARGKVFSMIDVLKG